MIYFAALLAIIAVVDAIYIHCLNKKIKYLEGVLELQTAYKERYAEEVKDSTKEIIKLKEKHEVLRDRILKALEP